MFEAASDTAVINSTIDYPYLIFRLVVYYTSVREIKESILKQKIVGIPDEFK